MKRPLVFALVTVLMLVGSLSALAQDGTPEATEEPPPPPVVFVRQDPTLGPFFTDTAGMTLYIFSNDTEPGVSTCYDQCAENWPIFTTDQELALPNGVPGELTLITRDDGSTQVAYNGMPLYYFVNDTAPGDVTGHGRGDVWWVAAPGMEFGAPATPVAMPDPSMATPAAASEVAVTLTEFSISASEYTFAVGQEYTFNVENVGQFPHELVIEPAGVERAPLEADGMLAEVPALESTQTATLTWTFSEPGVYQLACHIRSHFQQGMVVTIRVV